MTNTTYTVARFNKLLDYINRDITPQKPAIIYPDEFKQAYIDCLNALNTKLNNDGMDSSLLVYISFVYDHFYYDNPNTASEKFTNLVRFAENKIYDFYGLDTLYCIITSVDNIDNLYQAKIVPNADLKSCLGFTIAMLNSHNFTQAELEEAVANWGDELVAYYNQNPELFKTLLKSVLNHGYDLDDCLKMLVTVVQTAPYLA